LTYRPIQALFEGPLDIVGDLHGEITALHSLLARLGYQPDGCHPGGRRLVFVGDLVDRGEDSPAVVDFVMKLTAKGLAQCVLGNHELNLLRDSRKEGNGWFYPDNHDQAKGHFIANPKADTATRAAMLDWFAQLPLALEREDLRVVHACWDRPSIERLRDETRPVMDLYNDWEAQVDEGIRRDGLDALKRIESDAWRSDLRDQGKVVPLLPATAEVDVRNQSMNPVEALTSGIEKVTSTPFWGGGQWRMTERNAWWNTYNEAQAVVFGHYWRWAGDERDATARSRGPNLFDGTGPWDWLGPQSNTMCVDYCAGLRWRERAQDISQHTGVVAAIRWPEKQVVSSD